MKHTIVMACLIVNLFLSVSHSVCVAKTGCDNQATNTLKQDTASISDSYKKILAALWGNPAPNALYAGMVTYHLGHSDNDERWNNNLIAVSYHGYFAGTLKNSFDDRAYAVGIERLWGKQLLSDNVSNEVGYRLGLISGYDERMIQIAKYTPVLPFPQVTDTIMWKHIGLQVGWSVVTVSAIFTVHF